MNSQKIVRVRTRKHGTHDFSAGELMIKARKEEEGFQMVSAGQLKKGDMFHLPAIGGSSFVEEINRIDGEATPRKEMSKSVYPTIQEN